MTTKQTTTTSTKKDRVDDAATLKLSKAAATLSTKVGKALDQQSAGARDFLLAIIKAPKSVTRDQLRAAVYQAYTARGNSETTAKIRASEAGKVWDSRDDVAELVESKDVNSLQGASKAIGNIKAGRPWDEKTPSKQRKGSGAKTPAGPGKSTPAQAASAVPSNVTKAIAQQSLRDHINRLKSASKDEAAVQWLAKITDVIDLMG